MYATANDMRDRYTELALVQLAGTAGWDSVAIAKVNTALADTASIIDGYVAKYYAPAPGRPVPALLVRINCKLAWRELARSPTDEAKEEHADAMRQLRDISNGLIKLDDGAGDLPSREGQVIVPDAQRIFSRDRLGGF